MATIIDELIVQIRMDASQMKPASDVAETQLKRIRDAGEKTGLDLEQSGKRMANAFSIAKVEALALFSLITGGAGLLTALNAGAKSMADFGRNAANLNNMDPSKLDAWGMALRRVGGSAEDAFQSFNAIGRAIAEFNLLGNKSGAFPFMNAIGGQRTDTPEQIAMKFSQYVQQHPEKSNQEINVLGAGIGMTQSMINLLRTGPANVGKELERSRELGVKTKEMIDVATKFNKDFTALAEAAEHLKDKFETGLMPTADAVVKALTNWIIENPNAATAAGVGGATVGGLAGTSVLTRMLGLSGVADAFGALAVVATKLAGVFGLLTTLHSDTADNPEANAARAAQLAGKGDQWRAEHPNVSTRLWNWMTGKTSPTPSAGPSAGGGGAATGDVSGGQSSAIDSATRTRAQAVHDEFVKQGMDSDTAWAFAANSIQESGANPNSKPGDMGRAHGLFMWRDDAASGARALAFKARFGHMPEEGTLAEAVAFARWELNVTERGAAGEIGRAQGAVAKAAAVSRFYLRPKDREAEMQRRARLANGLLSGPRVSKVAPSGGYVPDPTLHSMLSNPGWGYASQMSASHDNSVQVTTGDIHVHTAATDAKGISHAIKKELHGAMSSKMIRDSNIGLT